MNQPLSQTKNIETVAKAGFIIFGLLFALLMFEIAVRVLESLPQARRVSDRPTATEMKFETRKTPQGLTAGLPPTLNGDFRIIALGDSFTFGPEMHQEDAYPARLERLLNQIDDHVHFTVLNFGTPGYSTVQEFQLLKKTYKSVKPDLVLLQITLNDPEQTPYRVTHPYLDNHGKVRLTSPIFSYLHSFKLITERIINTQTRSDYIEYYADLFNNPATFDRFKGAIHHISRLLSENDIKLATVIFPLFSHPLDKSYPFIEHHRKIHGILEAEQIPYLDLLHRFRGMEPSRLQVLPGMDSHPNEIAHRIAADTMTRWLIGQRILPVTRKATKRPTNDIKRAGTRELKVSHILK
jgi:hypothetical protein